MAKVGFVSLGCPKNLVDSEVMMGILARGGYELTPRADEADILVVNTCSFIESAQKESVDAILEMAEHKNSGAGAGSGRGSRYWRSRTDSASGERRIARASGRATQVSLSRFDPAHSHHAQTCRVYQNRRGLRSSLHFLHHPGIAW